MPTSKEHFPKEEPDEKQEKCDQVASAEQEHETKVARLHQHPHQANLDSESKQKAIDFANEQLQMFSQHIMNLRKDIIRAKSGVTTAHGEKECLEEMVEWAEEDLVQEQEEVEELKDMMRGEKILTAYCVVVVFMWTYHVVMVITVVCIIVIMLQNMLPQCI